MNIRVYEDAERRAMLVNVVDVPPLCNFILPAIIRTGPLAIAISTAGASPALAKRIRNEIAEEYGEPYARLAILLNEVRGWAKGTLPTYQDRKEFFEAIVNGEPDPVELLRRRRRAAVRDLIAAAQQSASACLTSSHISTSRAAPGWSTWAASPPPTAAPWRGPSCACRRPPPPPWPAATRPRATWSAPPASPASRPPSGPPS